MRDATLYGNFGNKMEAHYYIHAKRSVDILEQADPSKLN